MAAITPAQRPGWLVPDAAALCDALEAAGIRVAYDLRAVSPPIVLALPVEMRPATGCVAEIDIQFSAVAPGPGHGDAVGWLWGSVAPVLAAHCPLIEAVMFEQYPGLQAEVTGTAAIAHPQPVEVTP
jgi:hypothetical protein